MYVLYILKPLHMHRFIFNFIGTDSVILQQHTASSVMFKQQGPYRNLILNKASMPLQKSLTCRGLEAIRHFLNGTMRLCPKKKEELLWSEMLDRKVQGKGQEWGCEGDSTSVHSVHVFCVPVC